MLESPQILHILAAEEELLVNVSVTLPDEAKSEFEHKLSEAFAFAMKVLYATDNNIPRIEPESSTVSSVTIRTTQSLLEKVA